MLSRDILQQKSNSRILSQFVGIISQIPGYNFSSMTIRSSVKPSTSPEEQAARLAKVLDYSLETTTEMVNSRKHVGLGEPTHVSKIARILKKYNFPEFVIKQRPNLLTLTPLSLENRILIYQETGVPLIKPGQLLNSNFQMLSKLSITKWKYEYIICPDRNVVEHYVQILRLNKQQISEVYNLLPANPEDLPFVELRLIIMSYYLSVMLETEVRTMRYMRLSGNVRAKDRSFEWMRDLMEIYLKGFELSPSIILKNFNITGGCPHNATNILEMGHLFGVPVKELIQQSPRLVLRKCSSLKNASESMARNEFNPSAMKNTPQLLGLKSEFIQKCMDLVMSFPSLAILKKHLRAVELMLHHESRVQEIEKLNMAGPGPSLNTLIAADTAFENFLENGYKKYSGQDIVAILKAEFPGKTSDDIRQRCTLHPNWSCVSAANIMETLNFLCNEKKINKDLVYSTLQILLYPVERLQEAYLTTLESGAAKCEDPWFLHMLLYFLEKPYHFSGDGIWTKSVEQVQAVVDGDREFQEETIFDIDNDNIVDDVDTESEDTDEDGAQL